ncbi:MAG TPA: Crp/Fnr family transcriptional regulator [Mucilaginibacter sp.]|jgi:CRP-like cAMP-binding protein
MYNQLKKYLNLNIPVNNETLDAIVKNFNPLSVKKNTVVLSHGETCNKLYFVNKGGIRTYYITEQGQERTRLIALEGMIATSLGSFISQQPSFEFVDALENSELLYISRDKFYKLADEYPEWEGFYIKLLEFAYLFQNKKIEELVTLSAGERYAILIKEHPAYIQRLSNKVLASYLDITQETLSRLKSK